VSPRYLSQSILDSESYLALISSVVNACMYPSICLSALGDILLVVQLMSSFVDGGLRSVFPSGQICLLLQVWFILFSVYVFAMEVPPAYVMLSTSSDIVVSIWFWYNACKERQGKAGNILIKQSHNWWKTQLPYILLCK
jgi:hypothetical protein